MSFAAESSPLPAGELKEDDSLNSKPASPEGDKQWIPESRAAEWLFALGCGLFAAWWNWPFLRFRASAFDEGIVLQGATRILRGELPYRDFFSFYTPGSYYLYAALFKVFGTSLMTARATLLFFGVLFSLITYLLARRYASRPASVFCGVLVTLACLPSRFVVLHNWDSTAVGLLAVYACVRTYETLSVRWSFVAGLFAGCTVMIEQSKGAGLVLGMAIAAVEILYFERDRWRVSLLFGVAGGVLLPCVAVFAYFAAHGTVALMVSCWLWPLHHYSGANRLPYGFILWEGLPTVLESSHGLETALLLFTFLGLIAISVLPILQIALWVSRTAQSLRNCRHLGGKDRIVVLATPLMIGCFLATIATHRADFYRLKYQLPMSLFLLPLVVDIDVVRLPGIVRTRGVWATMLFGSILLSAHAFRAGAKNAHDEVLTPRGVVKTESRDTALPYLISHVSAGERVLIYPYYPSYSFLSGTFSPTYFEFLQQGMNPPEEFARATSELERDRTRFVLIDEGFASVIPIIWPATPEHIFAQDPMEDWIFAHYKPCKTLLGVQHIFEFMVRRDLACPAD